MTREEWAKHLPMIQAFVRGEKLQVRLQNTDWKDATSPSFWSYAEYRVKPEPKEIWVNEHETSFFAYSSRDKALRCAACSAIRKAVKYLEVIE